MKVKIVILNWNGRAHLERFLPSVVAHSGEASVVVADNGSNDDSVPFLREHYPQVELLQLDQNYGFAEGYNRALSRIEADCYVLLNSDVEVEEGWLNPLVTRLAADEKVAALAPKIISYERKSDFEYAGAAAPPPAFLRKAHGACWRTPVLKHALFSIIAKYDHFRNSYSRIKPERKILPVITGRISVLLY